MNLKAFHLVFINASILLCMIFAFWAWKGYSGQQNINLLITTIGSLGAGAALIVYEMKFMRKIQ